MGTELVSIRTKEDNDEFPSVPPGFESCTSFPLRRVEDNEKQNEKNLTKPASAIGFESQAQAENVTHSDSAKVSRSLRRRPGINYGRYGNSSDEESDSERLDQNFSQPCLPRGVIRGCPDCNNCQKVVARWRPEDACRPSLEDAPVLYPTEEEFQDTLKYIASIRSRAEPYGICRIVPPPSWKPPCPLKEKGIWEGSKFATRVQRIDKLQNRNSMRKISRIHNHMKRKRRRCSRMGMDSGVNREPNARCSDAESFGFEPGPQFTLETFQRYADDFRARYFRKIEDVHSLGDTTTVLKATVEPSVENIEGEYWRMVEKPTEEIEVLYGADLETGIFGSGFPRNYSEVGSASHECYIKSGWNLNNFARLPGSMLSYESSDISGVLVPWLYIGMCFSSFCWHVEDHHLYSLNYMHWGAPKMWYGVPGRDACKLEEVMRKHLPELFEEQPDLLHKLITQLSPSVLKSEGVPVYRCVQNPGEFVLTFPRAFHSGFNCGFNCAEAVNVAPVDWLPHGQVAIELYQKQGRKTSISHDKLLLGVAREAIQAQWEIDFLRKNSSDNLRWKEACGKDGILVKTLKARVEMERTRRKFSCCSAQALKMESSFDATSERECSFCYFDLHLSAVGCRCSPDRYACLDHARQLCSCDWVYKFFLFRYDISELDILVEALEGKLSAVYRWAKLDLGLALTSALTSVSEEKEKTLEELRLHPSSATREESHLIDVPIENLANSEKIIKHGYLQKKKSEEAVSPSSHRKELLKLKCPNSGCEMVNRRAYSEKEESVICGSNWKTPGSQEDISAERGTCKTSPYGLDNVILLSDDESDGPKMTDSNRGKEFSLGLAGLSDKASPCNNTDGPNLTIPVTDATVMGEKNGVMLPHESTTSPSTHLLHVKQEHHRGIVLDSTSLDLSCRIDLNSTGLVKNVQASTSGQTRDHSLGTPDSGSQNPQHYSTVKPKNEDKHEKLEGYAASNRADSLRIVNGNLSCSPNNLERYCRQKGPRIAKVVRRINCNVELLEFGFVLSGKSWCNSRAIFPKGFRSRVRYMSVLDPSSMSYYVSEILDAGRDGPLFMVSLEHCPNEVFIHISPTRCWEMVRERVNQEITKQHKLGKKNLPPLQPPGSLDGFEMFGFSSPAIVQAVEALDRNRVCNEYWDSRPYSRPQGQIAQASQPIDNGGNLHRPSGERNGPGVLKNQALPLGVDAVLRNLFRKANAEELNSLYSILGDNTSSSDRSLIAQLLKEQIHHHPS